MLLHIFAFLFLATATAAQSGFATVPKCIAAFREFDGICTSKGRPAQRLWGSADRIYLSLFVGRDAQVPAGDSRPSARKVSNKLFTQTESKLDRRGLNQMAAYFTQFILHDVSITPINEEESFDIPVPPGDKAGMFTDAIPFFRSLRGSFRTRDDQELPINMQTSAIDLSNVYGASKARSNAIRTGRGGMLILSEGDLLPIQATSPRLPNLPMSSSDYFLSGDSRANENPVLTSLHTIFAREHNRIAEELAGQFSEASDEMLFMKARLINGAQFQKIVYDEWFPAMTNRSLPPYTGFEPEVDPTVSVTFSTAGFQAHHSMTGNDIKRRGPRNARMTPLMKGQSFFRTVSTLQDDGVEPYLRGAFVAKAEAIDAKITNTRRDLLYSEIPGLENKVDIASEVIQRGRDHGLPSYNKLRTKFGMPKAEMIKDITSNRDTRKALSDLYGSPSNIDAYPGMLAEDNAEGSSMGSTMLNMWIREFRRMRDGDRFYFRSNRAIPEDLMDVPTVKNLLSDEDTFRRIVLANSDVAAKELPRKMFFSR